MKPLASTPITLSIPAWANRSARASVQPARPSASANRGVTSLTPRPAWEVRYVPDQVLYPRRLVPHAPSVLRARPVTGPAYGRYGGCQRRQEPSARSGGAPRGRGGTLAPGCPGRRPWGFVLRAPRPALPPSPSRGPVRAGGRGRGHGVGGSVAAAPAGHHRHGAAAARRSSRSSRQRPARRCPAGRPLAVAPSPVPHCLPRHCLPRHCLPRHCLPRHCLPRHCCPAVSPAGWPAPPATGRDVGLDGATGTTAVPVRHPRRPGRAQEHSTRHRCRGGGLGATRGTRPTAYVSRRSEVAFLEQGQNGRSNENGRVAPLMSPMNRASPKSLSADAPRIQDPMTRMQNTGIMARRTC